MSADTTYISDPSEIHEIATFDRFRSCLHKQVVVKRLSKCISPNTTVCIGILSIKYNVEATLMDGNTCPHAEVGPKDEKNILPGIPVTAAQCHAPHCTCLTGLSLDAWMSCGV